MKALKLFLMIERFKIFSAAVSYQPQSESQFLLKVPNIVTQQCIYKSTDVGTIFLQLFIACFSCALFSLILSHTDFVCECMRVHVCLLFSCASLRALLSYSIY